MCTMILAFQLSETAPLLAGHNRDERLDRPTRGPELLPDHPCNILAPIDERAGGSWLGINQRQLFVAITNRFGANPQPGARSRGELVLEALAQSDALQAAAQIEALVEPERYGGFHLMIADPQQAFLLHSDQRELTRRALEPGLHFITEQSLGAGPDARSEWIAEQIEELEPLEQLELDDIAWLLSRRDGMSPFATIVDLPFLNYGTRSSALVQLGGARPPRFLYNDQPPDRGSYQDVALEELFAHNTTPQNP